MANLQIRKMISDNRLRHYEVAGVLGISEYTFCKWMRTEFTEERKKQVQDAIQSLIKK